MDYLMWVVISYLIVINIIAFIVFGVDKSRARRHAWRVPEATLFALAIFGGSIGAIAGMYFFRHKTRHWYFVIGMPLILILQLAGAWYFGLLPFSSGNIFPQTVESASSTPTESVADVVGSLDDESKPAFIEDDAIPDYDGDDVIIFNNNEPLFTEEEKETIQGESYSELDSLGRCGVAVARLHRDMMPEGKRGSIGHIRPSGWHTVKYPDLIKDRYLFNRSHLIAYAMTGQTDNEKNLITGTRYMNADLMLDYELKVIHYLEDTGNHVLYRVRPRFKGDELVARGVEMEAWSVEDEGAGLEFHVFVYNVQPGIEINYKTGESWRT